MPAAIQCGARSIRWSCSPNGIKAESERHFEACGASREAPWTIPILVEWSHIEAAQATRKTSQTKYVGRWGDNLTNEKLLVHGIPQRFFSGSREHTPT
jgi:hypothetical protein